MTSRGCVESDFEMIAFFLLRAAQITLTVQRGHGKQQRDFFKGLKHNKDILELRNQVEAFASQFALPGSDCSSYWQDEKQKAAALYYAVLHIYMYIYRYIYTFHILTKQKGSSKFNMTSTSFCWLSCAYHNFLFHSCKLQKLDTWCQIHGVLVS